MIPSHTMVRAAWALSFMATGAAFSTYFIVWSRLLGLSFGNTAFATVSFLFTLFCGMALGGRLSGNVADKVKRPLMTFGILTAATALYSLLASPILGKAGGLYLSLAPDFSEAPSARYFLVFSLTVACLTVPGIMVGSALVFAARCYSHGSTEMGNTAGNCHGYLFLGATAGAIATRYWLLPAAGTAQANTAFAVIGIAAGASAVILGLSHTAKDTGSPQNLPEGIPAAPPALHRSGTLLVAAAASGAAFTGCLTVWCRSLRLVIGPTSDTSAAVLVTVLACLALGSLLFLFLRARPSTGLLPFLHLSFSVCAIALLLAFPLLPPLFLALISGPKGDYGQVLLVQILISSIVIVPPSIITGMTHRCASGLMTGGAAGIDLEIGRFTAWWASGAGAGSLISALILVPALGVRGTLILAAGASLLAAVLTATAQNLVNSRMAWIFMTSVLALLTLLPRWDHALMVSGPSLYPEGFYTKDELLGRIPTHRKWELLLFDEGMDSNTAVVRTPGGSFIAEDGRIEGGTLEEDVETSIKLALIPMLLHPEPDRVAILGVGTGITAYTAARFDTPGRVDVAEADASAIRAQKTFSPGELDAFRDPRVRLNQLDNRPFLGAVGESYDVIICDAPETWVSGAADLFTREFYRSVLGRMAPGGIFCQRLRGLTITETDLRLVLRTVLETFPRAQLWEGGSRGDLFLLCPWGEWPVIGLGALEDRLRENGRLLEFLDTQGDRPIDALLSGYRLDAEGLSELAGEGPRNTDDRNILAFQASRGLYEPLPESIMLRIHSPDALPYPGFISDPVFGLRENRLRMGSYLLARGLPGIAMRHIRTLSPLPPSPPTLKGGNLLAERLVSGETLREDFDGPPTIPYFILGGGYRPGGPAGQDTFLWQAYQELCSRISGPIAGVGREGSNALVIRAPDPPVPVAFVFPLKAEPETTYDVSFWLKNEADAAVEAGAGHMEYRAVLPYDESFTIDLHTSNLAGGTIGASVRGSFPWTRHTFSITTGPDTRMIHLQIFRFGESAAGTVFFDDIGIRKVGGLS